jgi:hypothetical protein
VAGIRRGILARRGKESRVGCGLKVRVVREYLQMLKRAKSKNVP